MNKAEKFMNHAEKMKHYNKDGLITAQVLNDGSLRLYRSRSDEFHRDTGIDPREAYQLGKWLVEMYADEEGKDETRPRDI